MRTRWPGGWCSAATGWAAGPLSVDGRIVARSGDVVLIAPNVQVGAQALVQSPTGATLLAAGQKVELTGRGLEGIRLEVQAPSDQVVNLGTLQGDAVGIFAGQLKHSGLIQATGISAEGGKVVLRATGDNLVDGRILASAGDKGGTIDVLGGRVALFGNAALDASGVAEGGQVRVGGDFQGQNADVPNAGSTFVGEGVTINADATQSGDGGRVIVWSDDATRFRGQISARGGADGRQWRFYGSFGQAIPGVLGTRRPARARAVWVRCCSTQTTSTSTPAGRPPPAPDRPAGVALPSAAGRAPASKRRHIETQLALSDVLITTANGSGGSGGGNIAVQAPIAWSSGNTLSLNADADIHIGANLTATSAGSANGNLYLHSAGGSIVQTNGAIQVANLIADASLGVDMQRNNLVGTLAGWAGTDFKFKNAKALTIGSIELGAGSLTGVQASGDVSITTTAGDLTVASGADVYGGGNVTLKATGSGASIVIDNGNYHGLEAGGLLTLEAAKDVRFSPTDPDHLRRRRGDHQGHRRGRRFRRLGQRRIVAGADQRDRGREHSRRRQFHHRRHGQRHGHARGRRLRLDHRRQHRHQPLPGSGQGGAITVGAGGDITLASIYSTGSDGAGGTVSVSSAGGSVAIDGIDSSSYKLFRRRRWQPRRRRHCDSARHGRLHLRRKHRRDGR